MPNKTINYDIHERIFNFVIKVINLIDKLPKTQTNLIFINQIIRSVTSMGANDQEADGSLTRKDFIHGFTVVRKEGKETVYWLKIISETNPRFDGDVEELAIEGSEIIAIVSAIIRNSSQSSKERK